MTMDNVPPEEEQLEEEEEEEVIEEPTQPTFAQRVGQYGQKAGSAIGSGANVVIQRTSEEMYPEKPTGSGNDEMKDLFKAPDPNDNDMKVDDVVEVTEEDVFGDGGADMSDITEVTDEDVMGEGDADMEDDVLAPEEEEDLSDLLSSEPLPPKKKTTRKVKRTTKRYPPTSGIQGMR